jgi:hypothetical protein
LWDEAVCWWFECGVWTQVELQAFWPAPGQVDAYRWHITGQQDRLAGVVQWIGIQQKVDDGWINGGKGHDGLPF